MSRVYKTGITKNSGYDCMKKERHIVGEEMFMERNEHSFKKP